MKPRAAEILQIAKAHDGRFLLPRRFRREPVGTVSDPDATEIDYEACRELVHEGLARWLNSNFSPGIELCKRG